MPRTDAAYQRIREIDENLKGFQNLENDVPTAADLAFVQIEATLAVAQATSELHGELDAIRVMIGNLR